MEKEGDKKMNTEMNRYWFLVTLSLVGETHAHRVIIL